ncbi:MAG: hypothetical protein U0V73_01780 [Acidimicrobiia bacterium]
MGGGTSLEVQEPFMDMLCTGAYLGVVRPRIAVGARSPHPSISMARRARR